MPWNFFLFSNKLGLFVKKVIAENACSMFKDAKFEVKSCVFSWFYLLFDYIFLFHVESVHIQLFQYILQLLFTFLSFFQFYKFIFLYLVLPSKFRFDFHKVIRFNLFHLAIDEAVDYAHVFSHHFLLSLLFDLVFVEVFIAFHVFN